MIKFRILKWENCPTLSRRASCHGRRKERGSESEEGGVKTEAEEGKVLKPRKSPLESGKGDETNHTLTKTNSKWITDLNIKCKTIESVEDNIRQL